MRAALGARMSDLSRPPYLGQIGESRVPRVTCVKIVTMMPNCNRMRLYQGSQIPRVVPARFRGEPRHPSGLKGWWRTPRSSARWPKRNRPSTASIKWPRENFEPRTPPPCRARGSGQGRASASMAGFGPERLRVPQEEAAEGVLEGMPLRAELRLWPGNPPRGSGGAPAGTLAARGTRASGRRPPAPLG